MTREQIHEAVRQLGPWFHCIDLGQGLRTKTESIAGEPVDHPGPTWQIIQRHLPGNLGGASVLDVGCNGGFYAVAMKRRGAGRVLGIDVQRLHVRQAMLVNKALGLDLEIRRASVYDLSPRLFGQFDITLALGLIYHCKHVMLALENLAQITRHTMVLETAVYPPHLQPKPFEYVHGGTKRWIHTVGYVENPPDAQESAFNWFLPSVDSLGALIRQAGFAEVEVVAVEHERATCICRKASEYPDSRVLGKLKATLTLLRADGITRPGGDIECTFDVENSGFVTWLAEGEPGTEKGAVRLGVHLFAADDREICWDFARVNLPHDVRPGEGVRLHARFKAPDEPGEYRLEFDMVDEHLAWFENLGSPIVTVNLRVTTD